jgi:hypothetical protein
VGLIDLSIVKDELGITGTTEDVKIQRYIDTISAKIIKLTGELEERVLSEKYCGTDTNVLVLKSYPIVSVEEIKINGEVIEDFEIKNKQSGTLYRKYLWNRGAFENTINNSIKGSDNQAFFNIEIDYTAGYDVIPLDVQDIALQEVIRRYENKWNTGDKKSWSLEGASESYNTLEVDNNTGMLKANIDYLINNYKDAVV